jgi:hypothetical protein
MAYSQAVRMLRHLMPKQCDALETAHWRYMCFAGISSLGEKSDRQAEADRLAFAHLQKFDEDGRPCISDERAAAFMSAVSGLPRDWCMAWDEYDFCNLHGKDYMEQLAKHGHL